MVLIYDNYGKGEYKVSEKQADFLVTRGAGRYSYAKEVEEKPKAEPVEQEADTAPVRDNNADGLVNDADAVEEKPKRRRGRRKKVETE